MRAPKLCSATCTPGRAGLVLGKGILLESRPLGASSAISGLRFALSGGRSRRNGEDGRGKDAFCCEASGALSFRSGFDFFAFVIVPRGISPLGEQYPRLLLRLN